MHFPLLCTSQNIYLYSIIDFHWHFPRYIWRDLINFGCSREKNRDGPSTNFTEICFFFTKIDIYASNFTLCGKAITTQLWNSHMFCFGKDVQYHSLSVTSLSSMSWSESRIFMSVMSQLLIMMLVTLLSCPEQLIMMLVAYWLSWTTKNVKCQWIQLQLF